MSSRCHVAASRGRRVSAGAAFACWLAAAAWLCGAPAAAAPAAPTGSLAGHAAPASAAACPGWLQVDLRFPLFARSSGRGGVEAAVDPLDPRLLATLESLLAAN
jgi:hypothetical protein